MSATNRKHVVCLAALAAFMGGCATVEPEIAAYSPAPAGWTWETAQRNTGSFGKDTQYKVTRTDGVWEGQPANILKMSPGGALVTRPSDGKWYAVLGPDGKPIMTYDPPIGWEFPLKVGKSWATKHRITTVATGKTMDYEFACKVEAFEKVTVRAGTFDAFRVHCTPSTGSDETFWSSPEVQPFVRTRLSRPAGSPFGEGTQEGELVSRPAP